MKAARFPSGERTLFRPLGGVGAPVQVSLTTPQVHRRPATSKVTLRLSVENSSWEKGSRSESYGVPAAALRAAARRP